MGSPLLNLGLSASGSGGGSATDTTIDVISGISATDVQGALEELASEKVDETPLDGGKQKVRVNGSWQRQEESLMFALSDRDTALTTGEKIITAWPFDMDIEEVFLIAGTQSSSGIVRVDIEVGGTSIFTTRPAIAANKNTSLETGGTASAFSGGKYTMAKGTVVTMDIDDAGTGAKELQVVVNGKRA